MERRLDYIDIDIIEPALSNPKGHQIDSVQASIDRFGYVAPMIVDDRTGRLVVGHGRLESLKARRAAGETPPDGIRVDGVGRWLAPVIGGWGSRSDADAAAYLVADNRHVELGGWDHQALADLLTEIGGWDHQALADLLTEIGDPDLIDLTGWDPADLEELLAGEELLPSLSDPDDVPGPARSPVSAPGDVWRLGQHRVLCGDSTDLAAVEAMMDGDHADCMWTDPPYGVSYVGKTADALTIQNDGPAGLSDLLAGAFAVATAMLNPGAPVYVAHPPGALQRDFIDAFDRAGWMWRQSLIWVKSNFVLGHSDYHYRHEPILYGFTPDGAGRLGRGGDRWYGDNAQDSIFEFPIPGRSAEHPTMKPVALITAMLTNSCPRRGLVYEPFGGSGSTLIAAHTLGMRAAVVELDPHYTDVICRRYQEHSGTIPERVLADGSTQPYDFTDGGSGA